MSQHDSNIYKPFFWVLGSLVVFTLLIAVLANLFSPESDRSSDPLVQEGIEKQIAPVGQSRVEPAREAIAPAPAVTEAVAETKQAVVTEADTAATDVAATETETAETEQPAAEPAAEAVATITEAPVANNTAAAAAVTASTAAVAATAVAASDATDATEAALGAEIPLKVRAVVATNCAGCHQEGVKGAQRTDDSAAWSALAGKGLDALTASVISGKGAMMPRAETSLSDDELGLAVQHMIAKAVGDGAGMAPPTTEEKSDSDAAATAESEPAVEAEPAAEVEPAAEAEKPAEPAIATTTAATSAATTTATAVTAVTAATTSDMTAPPANVKKVVDTLCAGCHISGVADAPKFGDKVAWDERMAMGMDKLLASSIAGKGAMPARGGSQLSDAELRLAIAYMATK